MFRRKFRGGRGGFRSRPKRPTNWLVNTPTYDNSVDLWAASAVAPQSLELTGVAPGVTTADPPSISRYRIETVKGEVVFMPILWGSGETLLVGMGIMAVSSSTATPTPFFNPLSVNDGDASWMWLKHFHIDANAVGQPNWNTMLPVFVSTKSKRVLKDNTKLMLYMNALSINGSTATSVLRVRPYLRTLISGIA